MIGKNIHACIQNCIDVLVKATTYKDIRIGLIEDGYSAMYNNVKAAERFIAYITRYNYANLNPSAVLAAFSQYCHCSVQDFKACLHTYIEQQEASLWQSLSMDGTPSEEELIEHILYAHLKEIAAGAGRQVNKPPKRFSAMLWNPVIDAWNRKWETACVFHARLYDIHDRIAETSPYAARDYILDLADRRLCENPGLYSRYVIFIQTPFNDTPVIYTVGGSVGAEHICLAGAAEWKAVYYDYTDQVIASFTADAPMDKKMLTRNMKETGAIYCVLSYRYGPQEDFTVQLYQSNKYFNSPDAVAAIEEKIVNYYPFVPYDTAEESPQEWKAVLYDGQDRVVITYMSHTKMRLSFLLRNMMDNDCRYFLLYHRNGPHEEFSRC